MVFVPTGGALMVTGALLPWLTLLAGLQAYRGILNWNGCGVLAAGAIVALGGATSLLGRAGCSFGAASAFSLRSWLAVASCSWAGSSRRGTAWSLATR